MLGEVVAVVAAVNMFQGEVAVVEVAIKEDDDNVNVITTIKLTIFLLGEVW